MPGVHAAPGDLDPLDLGIVGNRVFASAVQPDGKIIIAGQFERLRQESRTNIARVNADGTLDSGFAPTVTGGDVFHVIVQADGQILLGGSFTTVAGTPRSGIARVAANGTLDAGFNPGVNGYIYGMAVQPDGQILLGGNLTSVNGTPRLNLARVAANGTLDAGFNPGVNGVVNSIALQADGLIVLGGAFTTVAGTPRNRIARLAANGMLDANFNPDVNSAVKSIAVQADGQILLGGSFTTVAGTQRNHLARVAANGTLDTGFNPNIGGDVSSLAVQADGQILLGGAFAVGIARVAANGTIDVAFRPLPNNSVYSIEVQANGQVLLGGEFDEVGVIFRNRFARLQNDPATQSLRAVNATQVLWSRGGSAPDVSQTTFELSIDGGSSYAPLGGTATRVGSTANWQLSGLNLPANGQLRARGRTSGGRYNGSSGLVQQVADFSLLPPTVTAVSPASGPTTGNTLVHITGTNFPEATAVNIGGVAASAVTVVSTTLIRATTGARPAGVVSVAVTTPRGTNSANTLYTYTVPGPGNVDPLNLGIVGSFVCATVVQPDGKTIIAGSFSSVLGQARSNIARLNANGTLDVGFNPDVNGIVYSLWVQADGQILLGGGFTTVSGTTRNRIARIAANGTLDGGFNPSVNNDVFSVAVQADGQILLGGGFTTVGGTARNRVARIAANGTLDVGFNPNVNNDVYSVAVQADGPILLGGSFTTVAGMPRNRIARVAENGTLDAGFNPDVNGAVVSIAVQAEGRILLGGEFITVAGTARKHIARVTATGALDAGFNVDLNGVVYSVAAQADGKILLGGVFTTVAGTPRNGIARVAANSTLDAGFNPDVTNGVYNVALQANGQVLLGGPFTEVAGTPRRLFARLLNDPATQSLNAPNATQVLWSRGGSAPDVNQATFELSTDGGSSYAPLGGTATRVGSTANWQLSGLNLPADGQVRARGRTSGGYLNGSSGSVEQVWFFSSFPPIVTAVSPASGLTTGNTIVHITGTNIGGATAVNIGGVAATAVTVVSSTNIRATTGARPAGVVSVEVTTPRGTNSANTLYTYRVPGPGDVDSLDLGIVGGFVCATAVQPDGKTIIAGNFSSVLGYARSNIARLNANGTLDLDFNPDVNGVVYSLGVQADGQILLGGGFTTVGGTTRNRIARIAANGTLDGGFNPSVNNDVYSLAVQANGQILLGGGFTTVGGTTRNRIARIAANGTLDGGFNPNANNAVYSLALQADGRILLGGSFTVVEGSLSYYISRVYANGFLDASFDPFVNGSVVSVAVQADGQILLGGEFTTVDATPRRHFVRLAADGRMDAGFNVAVDSRVNSVAVQADGQILLGGVFTTVAGSPRNGIARVGANGALDAGFNPAVNNEIYSVAVQANGQVLLGGAFTEVNGTPHNRFARLLNDPATQSLRAVNATQVLWSRGGSAPDVNQTTFELSTNGGSSYTPLGGTATRVGSTASWQLSGLSLPASGQLRARGRTSGGYLNGGSGLVEQVAGLPPSVAAINPASGSTMGGTIVTITGTGFTGATAVSIGGVPATGVVVVSSSSITATTGARAAGAVSVDITTPGGTNAANTLYTYTVPGPGDVDPLDLDIAGSVSASAVQPDGKTIIAGRFTSVLGQPRMNIARLNADGTLDSGFNPNAGTNTTTVECVAVQADGRILFGGNFTTVGGTARNRIARVDAAGALDPTFNPNASNTVRSLALEADGRILLGGDFTNLAGTSRNRIARVDAAGALDASFNPNANGAVESVVVQADGMILLGGSFGTVGGIARTSIARVGASGALDASFSPSVSFGNINSLAVQADGSILLAGDFTLVGAFVRNRIARVNAAGAIDTGFNPNASSTVVSMAVQADGRILLGGAFTSLSGTTRNRVARVNAAGTLDASFNPNANAAVNSIALQADGKIQLGGSFSVVTGVARNRFARLVNDAATQNLSAPSPTQLTWTRGGILPEVSLVTFEQSTNGGATWTLLGSGTRIGSTASWQLTGLALTGTGQLRARGRTTGGQNNGSSGLVESLGVYNFVPEIAVSGNGVDIADGDATPAVADHSDFGSTDIAGGTVVRTYTITNSGTTNLTLESVSVGGTHAADFAVSLQPASPVAPSGSTSFSVSFDPSAVGTRSATLSFVNNDGDENPFNFAIQGTGLEVTQPTTTLINSQSANPTVVGEPYMVSVTVTAAGTPLGTVSVRDGTPGSPSCGPVALVNGSAACQLTSSSAGAKMLTAEYTPSSSAFAASSGTAPHQVNAAGTAISVSGPARSRINQPVSFSFALSVNAPGGGAPTGSVTLSDGTSSCMATLPATSCALTFSTLGARTLSAVFTPNNGNYLASSSSGAGNMQTLVFALADLAVTKTDAVAVYRPGDLLVYTITVRNLGPDTAANFRVRDDIPVGLSNITWSCAASSGAVCLTASGSGSLDVIVPSLVNGGLLTYTYSGSVLGSPASITNTALVELPADTTIEDLTPGNNSASDTNLLDALFRNGFETPGNNSASDTNLLDALFRNGFEDAAVPVFLGALASPPARAQEPTRTSALP